MATTRLLICLLLLVPAAALATDTEGAISLFAEDRQEWEGEVWRGAGNVRILYQDVKISCDEIEYDRSTMDLMARGNVVLDQGPRRFTADELIYNLGTKTGIFHNSRAQMPPSYTFTSERIEKLDETHYSLKEGIFTSCDAAEDEKPPWDFRIRSGLIEEEGYGRFRGAAIRIKHVPVFYLPYVLWPVKQQRAAGLMMPSFGYSQIRGAFVGNSLFVPIGRSYDTTFYLDLFSEKYVGIGSEWRWAPAADAYGEITGYAIRDPDTGDWEWKINGKHEQDDLLGFRLLAEIHDLSDIDFFQEFDRSFQQNTRRSLYSYAYLTRSWGPAAFNVRADRRTTFLSTGDVVLSQLPEVELRVRSNRIGTSDVYWTLVSSVNYFDVDRGNDLVGSYGRADLFPNVSYTLPGPPWITVTPRVGGRATYYTSRYSEDRSTFDNEAIDRTYLTGGVDIVGPSFSRIFEQQIGSFVKFKHLIEPRIEYEYLSDRGDDSNLVPIFDEVDSTRPTNRARVTLANRLFGRTAKGLGARELGSLELYQDYSFSEPLSYGSEGAESQRGPLGLSLRLTPVAQVTVDGRATWDTLYDTLRSTSLSAGVFTGGITTNLTWYSSYSPSTGDRTSSQVRMLFGFKRPTIPVSANLQLSYDIEKEEFQQQQYKIGYQGSCWGISVEYRDLKIGLYPTRDYRIVISLKDVGQLPEIKGSLDDSFGP